MREGQINWSLCLLLNRAFPASSSKAVGSPTGFAILDVVGRPIGFQEWVHSWSVIVICNFCLRKQAPQI